MKVTCTGLLFLGDEGIEPERRNEESIGFVVVLTNQRIKKLEYRAS